MENINSDQISATLSKISTAKSIQELDTQSFCEKMMKLANAARDYALGRIPGPESSEIPRAFLKGQPAAAFLVIIEFRSGKTTRDRNLKKKPAEGPVDLDQKSAFALVYSYFLVAFVNCMNRNEEVCREYLQGGCVPAALSELDSLQFAQNRDESPAESLTARAMTHHLSLLYSITSQSPVLKVQLDEELRRNRYFPILKKYTLSKYVSVLL